MSPAIQGDALQPRAGQIEKPAQLIARLHEISWRNSKSAPRHGVPHWALTQWDHQRRQARTDLANKRFNLSTELKDRLWQLHSEVPAAID